MTAHKDADFQALDRHATALGNTYRGFGVLIGFLGICVIFCAVAPTGFQLGDRASMVFGHIKVMLMAIMLLMALIGSASKVKRRWIDSRRQAELVRYQDLHKLIAELERFPIAPDVRAMTLNELKRILDGENGGQVGYNRQKAEQYESILRFSNVLGWAGFVLALFAAAVYLYFPKPWLIFITGFIPALIGGIHGINGFLRLGDLAEGHAMMTKRLQQLLEKLDALKPEDSLLELARITYETLNTHDVRWAEDAEKLGLKPA